MSVMRHWLVYEPREAASPPAIVIHAAGIAERYRDLGWRVEGPFVPEQPQGTVVLDDAAITRAADAIGALGTDRIGAEPYAAARAILDAARGNRR